MGFSDRFSQKRVRALATLARNKEVRGFEESVVDLLGFDEVPDVDGPGFLERRGAEVFLRQDDEAALLVFVSLYQLIPRDRFSFTRADPFEPHRRLERVCAR